MSDVPRRLPRSQGQRVRNIAITHASLSAQGGTAAARPVEQRRPENRIWQPPQSGAAVTLGTASGDTSTSITSTGSGSGTSSATGSGAVAVGDYTASLGIRSVAIGGFSYANGDDAVAIGGGESEHSAVADGAGAIAIGHQATAEGDGSAAFGSGAHATDGQVVIGSASAAVVVPGAFVLRDEATFDLYKLTVSGGTLSVTAYP